MLLILVVMMGITKLYSNISKQLNILSDISLSFSQSGWWSTLVHFEEMRWRSIWEMAISKILSFEVKKTFAYADHVFHWKLYFINLVWLFVWHEFSILVTLHISVSWITSTAKHYFLHSNVNFKPIKFKHTVSYITGARR